MSLNNHKPSKQTGCVLGRFAPLHKGHELLIQKMIDRHGIKNSLVIIGSSTSLNSRTPYNFEQRKKMIKTVFPSIEVIDIPDTKPHLTTHDEKDINNWLRCIKEVEQKRKTSFVFYGGSKTDLRYLSQAFPVEILLNRLTDGKKITATDIRIAIKNSDTVTLLKLVSPEIMPLLTSI